MKYDYEERVLFWVACAFGLSIDKAYSLGAVKFCMRMSAKLRGSSVSRPR